MAGQIRSFGRPEEQFTILANDFIRRPAFPPSAFRVACFVLSHGTEFTLDQAGIGRALDMSRSTVSKALADLEDMGLLLRARCVDERGHRVADDLFISQRDFTDEDRAALGLESLHRNSQRRDSSQPKEDHSKQEDQEETKKTSSLAPLAEAPAESLFELPKPPAAAKPRAKTAGTKATNAEFDAEFPAWYDAYPRHVGRGAAEKAYRAARRRQGVTAQLLLDAARSYALERANEPKEFTPHPASWLNGQRWLDEPRTPTVRHDASANAADKFGPASVPMSDEESRAKLAALREQRQPTARTAVVVHTPPRLGQS